MKLKHEYEAEITALKNRLIACEAAVKRLSIAHDAWIQDGAGLGMTDECTEFLNRLDDLYTLAGLNYPPAFELTPSPHSSTD